MALSHTRTIEGNVYDRVTGEYYGEYITNPYIPEPACCVTGALGRLGKNHFIEHDGTISPLTHTYYPNQSVELAPVVILAPTGIGTQTKLRSSAGPKPQVIDNPLAPALCILQLECRATPWLDDIAFGAILTGPGAINGKNSVSLADVKKVLRLSVISTATAASCLFNHERQPMSTRQVQRVIEAARTALRGIALYLERHPRIDRKSVV